MCGAARDAGRSLLVATRVSGRDPGTPRDADGSGTHDDTRRTTRSASRLCDVMRGLTLLLMVAAATGCSSATAQYEVVIAPLSTDFAAVVATIRNGSKDQEAADDLRSSWGRIGILDRLDEIRAGLEAALPTSASPGRALAHFIAATEAIAKIDQDLSPSCKQPGTDPITAALSCHRGPQLAPAVLADAANRADASWAKGIAELRH